MGYSGLVSISIDNSINPDLSFFKLFISSENKYLSILVIIFALSLTLSTIDTLINAISSLVIIDCKQILKKQSKELLIFSKYLILFISLIVLLIASKGLSILYLFLLADLLCCCAVVPIFSGFYIRKVNKKIAYIGLSLSLFLGLIIFPSIDFSKSILTHVIFKPDYFPSLFTSNLLFFSFIVGLLVPLFINFIYSLRTSFK